MTVFQSKVTINRPIGGVYQFLADLNNHQRLMPENIYNWSSTADSASFTIQNMAKLSVKVSSRSENKEIVIIPAEQAPFNVELKWALSTVDNDTTEVSYVVSADLNIMMKMLASGPLQKLVDHQTLALGSVFS